MCQKVRLSENYRPGVVAGTCNPASRRPGAVDGLRRRVLNGVDSCRPSVHTKHGVNKVFSEESGMTWLIKEERTGSGPKGSRQKHPRRDSGGIALANVSSQFSTVSIANERRCAFRGDQINGACDDPSGEKSDSRAGLIRWSPLVVAHRDIVFDRPLPAMPPDVRSLSSALLLLALLPAIVVACGPGLGFIPSTDPAFGGSRCSDLILYPVTAVDGNDQYRFDYSDASFGNTHSQGATVTITCTSGGRSATVEGYDAQRLSISQGTSLLATCTNLGGSFSWTILSRSLQFVDCR
uniref:Uncharacterized protein n=1 Tax=Plectus sambesii TaxID=2011161 RepID=A0A914VZD0_9BILA